MIAALGTQILGWSLAAATAALFGIAAWGMRR